MAVATQEQPRVVITGVKYQHRLGQIGTYALLALGAPSSWCRCIG
jgi:hypothetical protein